MRTVYNGQKFIAQIIERDPTAWDEEQRVNKVVGFIPSDVATMLEVGVGSGAVFLRVKKEGRVRIFGLDLSSVLVRQLQEPKVCVADAGAIPFKDGAVDLVLAADVLEHVDEEAFARTVEELKRVSRKYILINSPYKDSIVWPVALCDRCGTEFNVYGHLRSIDLGLIRRHFPPSRFETLAVEETGPPRDGVPDAVALFARRLGKVYSADAAMCPRCFNDDIRPPARTLWQRWVGRGVWLAVLAARRLIPDFVKSRSEICVLLRKKAGGPEADDAATPHPRLDGGAVDGAADPAGVRIGSPPASRKLLFLTMVWPPSSSAGAVRVSRLARYLGEFGWDVSVVAGEDPGREPLFDQPPPGIDAIRLACRSVPELLAGFFGRRGPSAFPADREAGPAGESSGACLRSSFLRELFTLPDEFSPWCRLARREAGRLLSAERFDAILSSGPPESAHLAARALASRFGLPWVADMRDLWSLDHYRPFPWWKRAILRVLERKVLGRADRIVTVSSEWAEAETLLLRSGGGRAPKVDVIPNGFDPEAPRHCAVSPRTADGSPAGPLKLAYAGKLHPVHQDPSPLFGALRLLKGDVGHPGVSVDFYLTGHYRPPVSEIARRHGVDPRVVRVLPPVPSRELDGLLGGYHAVLLFPWQGVGWEGWHSLKVFSYMPLRRPILAVGERISASLRAVLEETGVGVHVASASTVADFLDRRSEDLLTGSWPFQEAAIARYSYLAHAERLAAVLHEASAGHPRR